MSIYTDVDADTCMYVCAYARQHTHTHTHTHMHKYKCSMISECEYLKSVNSCM
jgi:hypothetical protein